MGQRVSRRPAKECAMSFNDLAKKQAARKKDADEKKPQASNIYHRDKKDIPRLLRREHLHRDDKTEK